MPARRAADRSRSVYPAPGPLLRPRQPLHHRQRPGEHLLGQFVVLEPPLEIAIEISQANLRRYGLTIETVAARLRGASVDLPGGGLKTASGEILVRVKERRDYGREFAEIPIITTPEGSEVLLGDIATIVDGFEETDRYMRYNGEPAVVVEVYRVGDQTPIEVAAETRRALVAIEQDLPPGISIDVTHDRSDIYRQRVDLLIRNGGIGLCLVMVLLGEAERGSAHTMDELLIRTPAGTDVPLREVATVTRGRAYMSIDRRKGRRVVQVSADVTPRSKVEEVLGNLKEEVLPKLLSRGASRRPAPPGAPRSSPSRGRRR